MRSARQQFLAELRTMIRTGRQRHPDQERPIGAALAARLPQILASVAERVKRGAAERRVSR